MSVNCSANKKILIKSVLLTTISIFLLVCFILQFTTLPNCPTSSTTSVNTTTQLERQKRSLFNDKECFVTIKKNTTETNKRKNQKECITKDSLNKDFQQCGDHSEEYIRSDCLCSSFKNFTGQCWRFRRKLKCEEYELRCRTYWEKHKINCNCPNIEKAGIDDIKCSCHNTGRSGLLCDFKVADVVMACIEVTKSNLTSCSLTKSAQKKCTHVLGPKVFMCHRDVDVDHEGLHGRFCNESNESPETGAQKFKTRNYEPDCNAISTKDMVSMVVIILLMILAFCIYVYIEIKHNRETMEDTTLKVLSGILFMVILVLFILTTVVIQDNQRIERIGFGICSFSFGFFVLLLLFIFLYNTVLYKSCQTRRAGNSEPTTLDDTETNLCIPNPDS